MEHVQVHPTGFVDPGDPDNGTKVWDLASPGSVAWLVYIAAAAAAAVMVTVECPCKPWQGLCAKLCGCSPAAAEHASLMQTLMGAGQRKACGTAVS